MSAEKLKTGKLPVTHSAVAKTLAFILAVLFMVCTVAGGFATAFCLYFGVYYQDRDELWDDVLGNLVVDYNLARVALDSDGDALEAQIRDSNIACIKASVQGEVKKSSVAGVYSGGRKFTRVYEYGKFGSDETGYGESAYDILWGHMGRVPNDGGNYISLTVWMDTELSEHDDYYYGDMALNLACRYCYWAIALCAAGLLGFVVCVVFLCCAAGRRRSGPEPTASWATGLPFDLITAGFAAGVTFVGVLIAETYWGSDLFVFCVIALCGVAATALLIWWIMSFALRVKLGVLWKNTFICWTLRLILRFLRAVWAFCRGFCWRLGLVWGAAAIIAVLAAVEFIVLLLTEYSPEVELLLWLIKTVVIMAAVVYFAYMLRDLQNMGECIANGDMSYRANTRFMPRPLKEHAENLSSIGKSIDIAVDERMKSERMKTELITNVSHDIKTPLTSIINYTDLISREKTENEAITEYCEVLQRQSSRLKRLIEDLVEASRASTGNIEMNMAVCEVGVMLMQVAAEYEPKLCQQQLSLVAGQPVHELYIMADGRRLWRVMDNLMGNICKYAMPGTRVYISLEDIDGQAVISFKNTSREALNMSLEELMERFVRGDAARHGEGSGLGLSIARSLTELQGGKLEISCDGDLFKAILRFPTVE